MNFTNTGKTHNSCLCRLVKIKVRENGRAKESLVRTDMTATSGEQKLQTDMMSGVISPLSKAKGEVVTETWHISES